MTDHTNHDFESEGVYISTTLGTADQGTMRIERIDFPRCGGAPLHDSDADAWVHMLNCACMGSVPHLFALQTVFIDNLTEAEAIMLHAEAERLSVPGVLRQLYEKLMDQNTSRYVLRQRPLYTRPEVRTS